MSAHAFRKEANGETTDQEVDLYQMLFEGVTTEADKQRRIKMIGKMASEGLNDALLDGFSWLNPLKQMEDSLLGDFYFNGVPLALSGDDTNSRLCVMVPIAGIEEEVCFADEGNFSNRIVITLAMTAAILLGAVLAVLCTCRCARPSGRDVLALFFALVLDALSAMVLCIPVIAHVADLVWAPLLGYLVWRLFSSKFRGLMVTLKQLILPVGNIIPLATIFWLVDRLI